METLAKQLNRSLHQSQRLTAAWGRAVTSTVIRSKCDVPILRLTNEQFEAVCLACMDYGSLGDRGCLTMAVALDFSGWSDEDERELEASIIKVLRDAAQRAQLTEIADALAMHWQDIDSPHGEYKSASSPLIGG